MFEKQTEIILFFIVVAKIVAVAFLINFNCLIVF